MPRKYRQRRTKNNPLGFSPNSINFRVLQLRHALGWTQTRLARVLNIRYETLLKIENGTTLRPSLLIVKSVRDLEKLYGDILAQYKQTPNKLDRLGSQKGKAIKLLPIDIRRPQDIQSLGKMEGDSNDQVFGKGTRRRMPNTGVSMSRKAHLRRKYKNISLALRRKIATGWRPGRKSKEVQSRQSDDSGE